MTSPPTPQRALRNRRLLRAAIVFPLAVVATRGLEAGGLAVARTMVRRQLEQKLEGRVRFDRFALRRDGFDLGHLTLDGRRDGLGANVESVRVACDWRDLVHGRVRVSSIRVEGALVSQGPHDARADTMVSPAALDRTLRAMHRDGLESIVVSRVNVRLGTGADALAADGLAGTVRFENERTRVAVRLANLDAQGEHASGVKLAGALDADGIVAEAGVRSILGGSIEARVAYDIRRLSLRVHGYTPGVELERIAHRAGVTNASTEGALRGEGDVEFVEGEFRSAQARLVVGGAAVAVGERNFDGDLALRLDAVRDRIKLGEIRTNGADVRAAADVVIVRDDAAHWVARTRGTLHAEGDAIARVAGYFGGAALQGGPSWHARRADVAFDARTRLDDLASATGSARIALHGLSLRLPGTTTPLEFASLAATIAPNGHGIVLSGIDARLRGLSVSGSLALSGRSPLDVNRFRADATVDVHDVAAVQALAPALPFWSQIGFDATSRAHASFHASGALSDRADRSVAAHWSVDNVRVARTLRMPDGHPLDAAVTHAEGDLDLTARAEGVSVALRDVTAQTSLGELHGSATLANGHHHVEASARQVDARVARWILPGTILGGIADGTLSLDGDSSDPVHVAQGHFAVHAGRYVFPAELHLASRAIAVDELTGNYRWAERRAVISDMRMRTDLGSAVGSMTVVNGVPSMHANLTTPNIAPVLDLFPVLAHLVQGGAATGTFDARFEPTGIRGTLSAQVTGGSIRIPEAPADIALQPVANGSIRMRFTPASFAIDSLALRGPKANVDFHTDWQFTGAVTGGGRVWLTNGYSHDLMRGYNWLARLVGMRTLHSDFTLEGRPDRVFIRAGITRTLFWRLGRGRVPRNVQAVLAGHAPVGT